MPDAVPWLELSDAVPDAVPLELFELLVLLLSVVPVPDVVSLVWPPVLGCEPPVVWLKSVVPDGVLLAASGGSDRHALVIEHQLRPLFAFFQTLTLPLGVYATDADFADYRISSPALLERIALATQRALPLLKPRQRVAQPA